MSLKGHWSCKQAPGRREGLACCPGLLSYYLSLAKLGDGFVRMFFIPSHTYLRQKAIGMLPSCGWKEIMQDHWYKQLRSASSDLTDFAHERAWTFKKVSAWVIPRGNITWRLLICTLYLELYPWTGSYRNPRFWIWKWYCTKIIFFHMRCSQSHPRKSTSTEHTTKGNLYQAVLLFWLA